MLQVCFATCFDQNIIRDLKLKEGKPISIQVKSANIIVRLVTGVVVSVLEVMCFFTLQIHPFLFYLQ